MLAPACEQHVRATCRKESGSRCGACAAFMLLLLSFSLTWLGLKDHSRFVILLKLCQHFSAFVFLLLMFLYVKLLPFFEKCLDFSGTLTILFLTSPTINYCSPQEGLGAGPRWGGWGWGEQWAVQVRCGLLHHRRSMEGEQEWRLGGSTTSRCLIV